MDDTGPDKPNCRNECSEKWKAIKVFLHGKFSFWRSDKEGATEVKGESRNHRKAHPWRFP
jgi:hypothetical protein